MLGRLYKASNNTTRILFANTPNRKAAFIVHKPEPTRMTHAECQQNEIIGCKGIQHPTFGFNIYDKTNCPSKVCPTPRDPNIKPDAIAHGNTQPFLVALSTTDLRGQYRPKISEPETTIDQEAIIYTMDKIALNQLNYVTAHLICETKQNNLILRLAPKPPNILNEMSLLFNWLVTQYDIHCNIRNFCDNINSVKNSNISLFNITPETFQIKDSLEPFSQTFIKNVDNL